MLCALSITRSPAQKPTCKDLGRNGQNLARLDGDYSIWAMGRLTFAFYNALNKKSPQASLRT
ncbi:hypothetical protein FEI14_02800 [Lacticaseibacillus zeae]|uniref:GON domain-containing protein n=1 Tax=Lacticaseibacillus zeae TaxID=57037 RepID=A0A5R8M2R4_LACZE|nr:hypothetical protein FEI14_02800 [Lacticaseibacillus zeae]